MNLNRIVYPPGWSLAEELQYEAQLNFFTNAGRGRGDIARSLFDALSDPVFGRARMQQGLMAGYFKRLPSAPVARWREWVFKWLEI